MGGATSDGGKWQYCRTQTRATRPSARGGGSESRRSCQRVAAKLISHQPDLLTPMLARIRPLARGHAGVPGRLTFRTPPDRKLRLPIQDLNHRGRTASRARYGPEDADSRRAG